MADLKIIAAAIHTLLKSDTFNDYCPNGIQVRGREQVTHIITGVSACTALFDAAIQAEGDLILVHHGLFWKGDSPVVQGSLKKRLWRLLEADLTLMAFHLPLDAHPQLGNNARLLHHLELEPETPFGEYHGHTLSWIGRTPTPEPRASLVDRITRLCGGEPLVLPFGTDTINRVAVCSGGAPELIREAKRKGADLYLTGEATEWVYHYAREEGINFIAAGHHRTERLGVQALGEELAQRFDVKHTFIDIDNPI